MPGQRYFVRVKSKATQRLDRNFVPSIASLNNFEDDGYSSSIDRRTSVKPSRQMVRRADTMAIRWPGCLFFTFTSKPTAADSHRMLNMWISTRMPQCCALNIARLSRTNLSVWFSSLISTHSLPPCYTTRLSIPQSFASSQLP